MSTTKEVVPMSTDELLAAMRELLPAKQEAPKALDFTGTGAVEAALTGPKVDRDAVRAALKRVDKLQEDIHKAEDLFHRGQYNAAQRVHYVTAAQEAIAEEYEALNLRLSVHARLREHGLI